MRNRDVFAVFNFHQITPKFDPKFHSKGTWTHVDFFEKQLRVIQNHFNIISLTEGIEALEASTLSGWNAAITLDDGDVSLERCTVPLLERLKIPATFFINSAYLEPGNFCWTHVYNYLYNSNEKNRFFLDNLDIEEVRATRDPGKYNYLAKEIENLSGHIPPEESFFVSNNCLKNLDDSLFAIGLHGHEHQRFSLMPPDWQRKNIDRDFERLSRFKAFKPLFAIPFGRPWDWDQRVIKICLERRLFILGCHGGINTQKNVVYSRIPADGQELETLVKKETLGWI